MNRFHQFLLESWARVYEVSFFVVEAYHLRFFIDELVTFLGDGLRLITESLNSFALGLVEMLQTLFELIHDGLLLFLNVGNLD